MGVFDLKKCTTGQGTLGIIKGFFDFGERNWIRTDFKENKWRAGSCDLTIGLRRKGLKENLIFVCCLTLVSKRQSTLVSKRQVMGQKLVCIWKEEPQPGGCMDRSGCRLMSSKCCLTLMIKSQEEVQLSKMNLGSIFCGMWKIKKRKAFSKDFFLNITNFFT